MRRCAQCQLSEGLLLQDDFFVVGEDLAAQPNVKRLELDQQRLCPYCRLYNQNYDKTYLQQELQAFLGLPSGSYDALVALSGGKDSLSALFLASKVLGLRVLAITYDNGFLPEPVLEQTARICEELEVDWHLGRSELYAEFLRLYQRDAQGFWQARSGQDFCQICSKGVHRLLHQQALAQQCCRVIYGNRTYTRLEPKVSALKRARLAEGYLWQSNLLFALRLNAQDQAKILAELKWQDPGLKAQTSNCLIPGFVDAPRRRLLGQHSDAAYLAQEWRSGLGQGDELQALESELEDLSRQIDAFFAARGLLQIN